MKSKNWRRALNCVNRNRLIAALVVVTLCCGGAGRADSITDIQVVDGACDVTSHIAEGAIGDNLTKRQSQFYCNSAVFTFYDHINRQVLIQFAEKSAHHAVQLGFGGFFEPDGQKMKVDHVYFTPDVLTPVSEGQCTVHFHGQYLTAISCAVRIDEDGRRTVALVVFRAADNQ